MFKVLCCVLVLMGLAAESSALAQTQAFPTKPIRMIVPYAPGATTDIVARLVADKMRIDFGQPVVVENRAGASGTIGANLVAKAPRDGYTILLATDALASAPSIVPKLPFNLTADFTSISLAANNLVVLVAHPSLGVSNVAELIVYAKSKPNALSYGSSGNGSPHHLAGILFNRYAGVNIAHIPYKGGGQVVIDVLAGQIPLAFCSLASVHSYIKSGRLVALGLTEPRRAAEFPDLPVVAETLPGVVMSSWLAFLGPAKMPDQITKKLNASIVKALRSNEGRTVLTDNGLIVVGSTEKEMDTLLRTDYEQRRKLIRDSNISAD